MKAAPFALAALAALVVSGAHTPMAKAEDTVHVCIAASTDGQTLRKEGKLLAARDQMIACARDACPAIVRSSCAKWLSEVEAAIPSVVVRAADATGADLLAARLTIDGHPEKLDGHPVRLDPGEHTLTIEADAGTRGGGGRKTERILLVEGEASRVVTIRLPPLATPTKPTTEDGTGPPDRTSEAVAPRGPRRVPLGAWVMGGVGVVALGAATYFGFAANGELNTLKATCSPHCADSRTWQGRTDALAFDVLLGAGAALVAGALVWGIAFPAHPLPRGAASHPRLEVGPIAGGAFGSLSFSY